MNRKSFYLEIGNIDDDLIQGAAKVQYKRRRKTGLIRLGSVAACFCLLCAAMLFGMNRDVVYYNETTMPNQLKVRVPSEENAAAHALDYQELFDHYGLKPLSNQLSGMQRMEQSHYFVYQLENAGVYDINMLNYHSDDGKRALSVLLEKETTNADAQTEKAETSKIDGVLVVLTVSGDSASPIYGAEFRIRGVSFRVQSIGMEEDAFTDLVRELIQQQK